MITLLDYGAGNVRSVTNAIKSLGETVHVVSTVQDILSAEKLVFPGVGSFGSMMHIMNEKQYSEALINFLSSGRPFLGICLGLHALFDRSEEAPAVKGLGIIPGFVKKFDIDLSVPHIGWNGLNVKKEKPLSGQLDDLQFYNVALSAEEIKAMYDGYGIVSSLSSETGTIPQEYSLKQNYPNPFNPETKIEFSLEKPGKTTLTIFNSLGQRIATLLDENLVAGVHTATFQAQNLASGVYFYRVESGKFVQVNKMVLIK